MSNWREWAEATVDVPVVCRSCGVEMETAEVGVVDIATLPVGPDGMARIEFECGCTEWGRKVLAYHHNWRPEDDPDWSMESEE